MVQKTSIEWTDDSANPIRARHKITRKVGWHCVKCSPGCANCYAEPIDHRFGVDLPYTSHSTNQVEFFFDEKVRDAILKMRKPKKIFLCDMIDLFQDGISDRLIDDVFRMMYGAQQHVFQILTKRAERMADYVSHRWNASHPDPVWHPSPNIWLGVSVENQKYADERIPFLLKTPAVVRFLSVEPLLGLVDLRSYLHGIDWVIVGGESGPRARPMHPDWARNVRDQCVETGVSFHFKQNGEWLNIHECYHIATQIDQGKYRVGEWHGDGPFVERCICGSGHGTVVRVGKKAAGRLLDGRTWDQFPKGQS